jgi:hypothetical protein
MVISEDKILNSALDFAMSFGKDWLKPTQGRLSEKYNLLTEAELDKYDQISRTAMKNAQGYIYDLLSKLADDSQKIKEIQLKESFTNYISNNYSWIDKGNLSKLYSQGRYYAYKDGLDCAID